MKQKTNFKYISLLGNIVFLKFKIMINQKLYKGSLQTIILNLLDEKGRLYGYEITKLVKEQTQEELKITEGALYPTLHKLEAQGILQVEMQLFKNRQRKYYSLTEKGTAEKIKRIHELERCLSTLQALLVPKTAL
jgi:PadR family transcriptional regulator, regulatory protein PadR